MRHHYDDVWWKVPGLRQPHVSYLHAAPKLAGFPIGRSASPRRPASLFIWDLENIGILPNKYFAQPACTFANFWLGQSCAHFTLCVWTFEPCLSHCLSLSTSKRASEGMCQYVLPYNEGTPGVQVLVFLESLKLEPPQIKALGIIGSNIVVVNPPPLTPISSTGNTPIAIAQFSQLYTIAQLSQLYTNCTQMSVAPNCYCTKLTILHCALHQNKCAHFISNSALKLKTADLKIRLNDNFHPFEGLSVPIYVELVRLLNLGWINCSSLLVVAPLVLFAR